MKLVIIVGILGAVVSAHAADRLPDAPRRVVDRKFLAVMTVEALAKSADILTTVKHLNEIVGVEAAAGCQFHYPDNCYEWKRFQEQNPLFGRNPSTLREVTENGGIFAGEVALTYWLKKKRCKAWWAPAMYFTANHVYWAKSNTRY